MTGEIGSVVTIKVLPGMEKEFEARFGEQAANVRRLERGNRLYDLYRHRTEPNTYIVLEFYDNAEAVEFHQKNGHMDLTRPAVRACIDGPMQAISGTGV